MLFLLERLVFLNVNKIFSMKSNFETRMYDFAELNGQELNNIYGGDFFGCNPSNCIFSFVASVCVELILDNIEHPIGTSAGYPPK